LEGGKTLLSAALPYLRILTLPPKQLHDLAPYLSDQQKLFFSRKMLFNEKIEMEQVPLGINTNTHLRSMNAAAEEIQLSCPLEASIDLIDKKLFEHDRLQNSERKLHNVQNLCASMTMVAMKQVRLNSIYILTDANNYLVNHTDKTKLLQ
jgi:hypothetical protein